MRRGEIWWASLPPPEGSGPGYRRPAVVIQSDRFNESRIGTVVVAGVSRDKDRKSDLMKRVAAHLENRRAGRKQATS